jgi:hypothetical protein
MARYSIADTTLTALGDAVRGKVGETEIRPVLHDYMVQSANATGFGEENIGGPYDIQNTITVVTPYTFAGATTITVKLGGIGEYDYYIVKAHSGAFTDTASYPSTGSKYLLGKTYPNNGVYIETEETFTDTDSVTIYEHLWMTAAKRGRGYYLEIRAYDADGNIVPQTIEEEVSKTMTPERMATEINNLEALHSELLHMSGNMSYKFYGGAWDNFLGLYGSKITTQDVTRLDNTFYSTTAQMIPFEINCDSSKEAAMVSFCQNSKLRTPPIINNLKISECNNMFASCNYIREFPEGYGEDWDWTYHTNTTNSYRGYKNGILNACYSLRKLPLGLLKYGNSAATYSYHQFRDMNQLYALDSATKLPCPHEAGVSGSGYSGIFYNMFSGWSRCKWLTFADDIGTKKWAKQTIDLSQNFGWAANKNHILSYNSGITADKEIKDEATYIALRNDPDSWTLDVGYSRYDLQSAISTINSLPDCSEYTASYGANTIKFKGSAGSKKSMYWAGDTPTSIGSAAISNLTDEHIAVAAAKGWTVAIV